MTYSYVILNDNPIGLWPLDSTAGSVLTDISGYSNNGTVVSGLTTDKPIVARGVAGQRVTGTGFTLPINSMMISGAQSRPFAYEFWFKHQSTTGTGTLFKRTTSGITISGNTITVTLSMSTALTLSYSDLVVGEIYHCVVNYDGTYIGLWINNSLVATLAISSTDYNASFTDVASTLTFGVSGGYTMVLDSIAIYSYALHNDQVDEHYNAGTDYPDIQRVSGYNNSHQWLINDDTAVVFAQISADVAAEWDEGTLSGLVIVQGDSILNSWSDTTARYETGTWIETLNIPAQAVTLAGSRITWESNKINTDVVVEISTNMGSTWTPVTNGSAPIGALSLASGADIAIRVTIAAGATQTKVNRINLTLYTAKSIYGSNNDNPILVNDPVNAVIPTQYVYDPASFSDNAGIILSSATNKLTIPADPVFGGYTAMEFVVKFNSSAVSKTVMSGNAASAQPAITTDASGNWVGANLSALYIDGVSVSTSGAVAVTPGVWHHVIVVFAATQSDFYLGNNTANSSAYGMQVSYVAGYFQTLTAANITNMYNWWVGATPSRTTDSSIVTIREHVLSGTVPCRAYTFNWSVTSAG